MNADTLENTIPSADLSELAVQANQAASFLRTLGNASRLQVLCLLIEHDEMSVGQILQHTTLSQSALSQHLAKMREEGLVDFRRDAQTLHYFLCNQAVVEIVSVLKANFCPSPDPS